MMSCGKPSRLDPFAKLFHVDREGLGEVKDGLDSRIANTPLDAADVGAIKIGLFCELILGKSAF